MRMIRAVQIDAALLRARYPLAFFFLAAAMAPEIPWWRDAAWAVFLIGLLLPRAPQLAGESRAMSASVRRGIGCGLLAAAAIYSEWGRAFSLCIAAGLIFGELLLADSRAASAERLFAIVLATVVLCFGIVPQIAQASDSVFYRQFSFYAAWGLWAAILLANLSARRSVNLASGDFLAAAIFALLMATLALSITALSSLGRLPYPQAVGAAALGFAVFGAVAAMMWLPLGGRGLSDAFMRHVLSLGVPMEEWVARLARLAETESDADSLLAGAMRELSSLPAIAGVRWLAADGKEKSVGDIKSPHRAEIHIAPIHAVVHSHRPVGPSARLSYSLLMRVAAEYYLSKLREERASRDNLARAVYETGARLTHDIKNILQAMQGLIALARGGDEKGVAVVRRQLPELARRLGVTLEKLKAPAAEEITDRRPANLWWEEAQKRRADSPARFILSGDAIADCAVPAALFDRALDNLLENALAKKTENGDLEVTAEFHCDEKGASLRVADNGDAVAEATANLLFKSPLNSETGLGIGLFHLSRQAEECGFEAVLEENRPGRIVFALRPATPKADSEK